MFCDLKSRLYRIIMDTDETYEIEDYEIKDCEIEDYEIEDCGIKKILTLVPIETGIYVYHSSIYNDYVYKVSSMEKYVMYLRKEKPDWNPNNEQIMNRTDTTVTITINDLIYGTFFAFQNKDICDSFCNIVFSSSN